MRATNHTWPWERCTVIQREKISALISTFLPIEAMRRAAQKFIKLIGRHEPRAWCSEKWHEIHWHWQLTAPLTNVVPTSLTICYFVLTGEGHLKGTLGRGGMLLYRSSLKWDSEISTRPSWSCGLQVKVKWMKIKRSPRTKNAVLVKCTCSNNPPVN